MTKNERKMLLELAKAISRLSQVGSALAVGLNDEETAKKVAELLAENETGIRLFIEMAGKEWVSGE